MFKEIHVVVTGKVQGVWFRVSTKEKALQYNLRGWVRNCSDGSVEAVFQGQDEHLDNLLKWINIGSEEAEVDSVKVTAQPITAEYNDFRIL